MKRRSFLNFLAEASALSLAPVCMPVIANFCKQPYVQNRHFGFSTETNHLGRIYLSAYPDDFAACRQLRDDLACHSTGGLTVEHALKQVWRDKIRDDFLRGNTVNLHGWILSRTELRLSTLNILQA